MEIGPIPGLRMMPAPKTPRAGEDIAAVFNVEALTRPADDTWESADQKAAAGQDADDLVTEESAQAETPGEDAPLRRVNLFA